MPVSKEKYEEISKPWVSSVVVKVIGKSFEKEFPRKEMQRIWKIQSKVELLALGKGFYAMHGLSAETRSNVLANGP